MDEQDYEYRDLMAATWDLFRGDTSQWSDKFFFRDIINRYGEPVLDVGCGTGRLTLDYLTDGVDIDGVDNSPEMLALCREKAGELGLTPNLFEQRMETLDLPRQYRTIIVPSSSFQLLTDPAMATQAMRRFYAHLKPGGVLAMPFMILWEASEPTEQVEWEQISEKIRAEDGAVARRWTRGRYDVENQLEHTEDRYEIILNGQVIASEHHQRSPAARWYTLSQAVQLYHEAGFMIVQATSFDGSNDVPATDNDTTFTIVGARP